MKRIIPLLLLFFASIFFFNTEVAAQKRSSKPKTVKVKSYTTKKGKHVRSHYRSKPKRKSAYYLIPYIDRRRVLTMTAA
jgi:hypothetical protein